ncbi:phenylacetic acid degradation protein [Azospirillum thiophilum]|uniref:Phenylacetic acid degradation protein n=1 Tax=Azospirillum thiophilum TaxID=528244 RepID=A0AAC8W2V8_9PROT|nr:1,2-phenylacetyl-CoA epoxidase subunit PaaE [Azospirillum thiophilum]ALG74073.1 phenylacetic acid degradation protein [Azospirillum thiophilum]KJR63586.1 phenylacetic acid degradation protein [Azospirillum thiophilum]
MTTPSFHPLTIRECRRETADTVSIAFDVPADLADRFRFVQGQYLTLKTAIGGEEVRRSYSICSGVDEGELRVAVKTVEGGLFSTHANRSLAPGAVLEVMTPMGRFHTPLDPAASRTYVAFAAGSGITPVMSILKTVLAQEPESRFVLVYGNRTVTSIIFREDLEDLKNRHMGRLVIHHVLSREPEEAGLLGGRIGAGLVRELCAGPLKAEDIDAAFLCGPQPMVEEVRDALAACGTPAANIHVELFGTTPTARPAVKKIAADTPTDAATIAILQDGKRKEFTLPYDGESILEAAHRHGADLPYSCKSGVCCTCRARVREGKVEMAENYSLEPWEVEAGYVLTCQSRPLTERVVIDFDAA